MKENKHKMMKEEEEARKEDEEFPMLTATHRDTSGEKPDEILKGVSVNTKDSWTVDLTIEDFSFLFSINAKVFVKCQILVLKFAECRFTLIFSLMRQCDTSLLAFTLSSTSL